MINKHVSQSDRQLLTCWDFCHNSGPKGFFLGVMRQTKQVSTATRGFLWGSQWEGESERKPSTCHEMKLDCLFFLNIGYQNVKLSKLYKIFTKSFRTALRWAKWFNIKFNRWFLRLHFLRKRMVSWRWEITCWLADPCLASCYFNNCSWGAKRRTSWLWCI